jgi:hypothetical protein
VARPQPRRRNDLRLVDPTAPGALPPVIIDSAVQKGFEQLTQALVDIATEITE